MDLFSPRTPIRVLPSPGTTIPKIMIVDVEAEEEAEDDVVVTPPPTLNIEVMVEEET